MTRFLVTASLLSARHGFYYKELRRSPNPLTEIDVTGTENHTNESNLKPPPVLQTGHPLPESNGPVDWNLFYS